MKKNLLFTVAILVGASMTNAQMLPQFAPEVVARQQQGIMPINPAIAAPAAAIAEATPAQKAEFARKYNTQRKADGLNVYYQRPAGVYFAGVSQKTALKTCPYLIVPPFKTTIWQNGTTGAPADTKWDWKSLTMNYQGTDVTTHYDTPDLAQWNLVNMNAVPTLSAINGTDTTSYQLHSVGNGNTYVSDLMAAPNPNTMLGMFSNYGAWYSSAKYFGYYDRDGLYSQAITYYSVAGDASTSSWFGKNEKGNTNACATAFEKPQNPYLLTKVNILFANANFTDSVKLYCRVYRLNEIPDSANAVPTPVELIAKGSAWLTENNIVYQSGRWGTLEFAMKQTYEGVDYDAIPEINFPIMVVVGGYNDPNMKQFTLFVSRDNNDEGFGELGYLCNIDENGDLIDARGFVGNWQSLVLHSAPSIFIQQMYTYMMVQKDEELNPNTEEDLTFNANPQGDTRTEDFNSYIGSEGLWQVTTVDGEAVPSWVTVTMVDGKQGTSNNYTGHTDVTFDVEPLPEGTESREVKIRFWYPGSEVIYTVKQQADHSAVTHIDADRDDANAATYNMMGQRVGRDARGLLIRGGKKILVK